jgi:NitT/TauT family transport system ATP-binding protein
MRNNKPNITVRDLSYSYTNEETGEKVHVLKDVSFEIYPGEFVSLVGPSGCGKSTLLKLIAGLITVKHGDIELDRSKISFVFQDFALLPWLTVKENIEFGLKMRNVPLRERERIAMEKIAEVGLSGSAHKHPAELSGGMKQRVGIARAIAMSPDILLMDEPFSSLDMLTAEKLRGELMNIWLKYKMTIVMVTHLIEEAVELSDRVLVFHPRPTSVKKSFDISIPRPRDTRSKEYFDLCDQIEGNIE